MRDRRSRGGKKTAAASWLRARLGFRKSPQPRRSPGAVERREVSGGARVRVKRPVAGHGGHPGVGSTSPGTRSPGQRGRERRRRKTGALSFLFKMRKRESTGTVVDPRMAERVQEVRETEEKRAFKHAIWLLSVMAVAGLGVWLAHSPYLTVQELTVEGQSRSQALQQIERAGLFRGTPMVSIDVESLRNAVLADPWVDEVTVRREWPNTVVVSITERHPVAWVLTGEGWQATAADGVILKVDPEELMPHISGLAGSVLEHSDPAVGPALTFAERLRSDLRVGALIEIHGRQITAQVAGRIVRLGRATDLDRKADVLGVLVDFHSDPGNVINLFSALRPAIYKAPATYDPPSEIEVQY